MRFEIIRKSTTGVVADFFVPELSLLDFQPWKALTEVAVPLQDLSTVPSSVGSDGTSSEVPDPLAVPVQLYIPRPVKDALLAIIKAKGGNSEAFCTPSLKHSTIFVAVAEEIMQNHLPNDAYTVRITDGR